MAKNHSGRAGWGAGRLFRGIPGRLSLRGNSGAVGVRPRCCCFLIESIAEITSGEVFQAFGLVVDSVPRYSGFGDEVLLPETV